MAVFSLACKLYTALCGFCLLEKRQRLILPKELQTKSLRSTWIYHGSHVGGDSTTATHTHKQGFVVATPGACASGSCLGGQLHHALVAQVDTDGIIAAHTGKLGSVVATPGASASHLPIGGSASTFAAQVDEDGAASTSTSRVGSVVATPFACASDRQLAGLALFTLTTQVGEDYTTYVHRPGSVDATPRARSPGLHLAGREVQTSVARDERFKPLWLRSGTMAHHPHLHTGLGMRMPHPALVPITRPSHSPAGRGLWMPHPVWTQADQRRLRPNG